MTAKDQHKSKEKLEQLLLAINLKLVPVSIFNFAFLKTFLIGFFQSCSLRKVGISWRYLLGFSSFP